MIRISDKKQNLIDSTNCECFSVPSEANAIEELEWKKMAMDVFETMIHSSKRGNGFH